MTERPVMERLIKARDLIAQRGLAQTGKFYDIRRKCYCTVGSLIASDAPDNPEKFMGKFGRAANDDPEIKEACSLINEARGIHTYKSSRPANYIFGWSDTAAVDEVLLTLDKAIELARVRGV